MTSRDGTESLRGTPEARVGEWLTPRWELYAFLGGGVMSSVYAATDPKSGERVAIKVFDARVGRDLRVRETFLSEVRALNAISHPARVQVLGDGVSDKGELFVVTELLAGSSLDHYMRLGGDVASVAEKLRLFDSVLSFLAECHQRGIVHRDIKPSNLQLTRSGQISVLDFGIARLREMEAENDPASESLLMHTSAFMAPEQALGLSDLVDGRADLWSVGACIYTLLSGETVRHGGGAKESIAAAATAKVPSIAVAQPHLPREVVAFVDKALSHDRARRFGDAQAMRAELNALRDDVRSGRAKPPSKLGSAGEPPSSASPPRAAPRESGVAWRANGEGPGVPAEDSVRTLEVEAAPPAEAPHRRSSASDLGRAPRTARARTFDPRAEPDATTPTAPKTTTMRPRPASAAPPPPAPPVVDDVAEGEQRRQSSILDAIRATANPHELKTVPPPAPSTTPSASGDGDRHALSLDEPNSVKMSWNDVPRLGALAELGDEGAVDVPITTDDEPPVDSPPASDIRELAGAAEGAPVVVGRYVIHDRIASGGMASVHIGRLRGPVGFSRTVAIKRMHPHFLTDPEFVSMFLDEARVATHVRHPNVVPTLDVVSTPREIFLVLEYAQGVTLSSLLRSAAATGETMPLPVALAIVSSVLHGLEAAHCATGPSGESLGLVHRDISPQNILVGPDGLARILDFGVAKASGRSQSTNAGTLKGKIAYMSPEQIRGGDVTRRADIYAAAVVLWESVTGRRLFHGANEASTLEQVLWGDVPTPRSQKPELPQALDDLVMRGLSRDPLARFDSAEAMATALEEALPVAITPVVGRWVREVAKDALAAQASRLARIESLPPDVEALPRETAAPPEERVRLAP
jgi:serine/threonine protein kinase